MRYLSSSDLLHHVIISSCIPVATNGISPFFIRAGQYCIVSMRCIFIHLAIDGHLDCFCVLAVVNSAAMNIGVRVSFLISILSAYMPRRGHCWVLW